MHWDDLTVKASWFVSLKKIRLVDAMFQTPKLIWKQQKSISQKLRLTKQLFYLIFDLICACMSVFSNVSILSLKLIICYHPVELINFGCATLHDGCFTMLLYGVNPWPVSLLLYSVIIWSTILSLETEQYWGRNRCIIK